MIIDAPAEFWDWIDGLEKEAAQGSQAASERLDLALAVERG